MIIEKHEGLKIYFRNGDFQESSELEMVLVFPRPEDEMLYIENKKIITNGEKRLKYRIVFGEVFFVFNDLKIAKTYFEAFCNLDKYKGLNFLDVHPEFKI